MAVIINFIDFEKAFDSVHRDSLWLIMRRYGIPSKIISMVKALYDDFACAVVDGQGTTEWFKVKTGMKQGCNMSALLFLLVVDWVIIIARREYWNKMEVQYKARGSRLCR